MTPAAVHHAHIIYSNISRVESGKLKKAHIDQREQSVHKNANHRRNGGDSNKHSIFWTTSMGFTE